jgi:transcriptional regulator GlxA family with amidase domain
MMKRFGYCQRHGRYPAHSELIQRRVERAQELPTQTSVPLVEITAQTGFRYQAAFARTFHKALAQPPGMAARSLASAKHRVAKNTFRTPE